MARGKGGFEVNVEGEVKDLRDVKDKTSGKVTGQSITVAFWGGEQYLQLSDATQAAGVKRGDWVKLVCGVKKFKDSMYCDHARVIEINEKAVKAA